MLPCIAAWIHSFIHLLSPFRHQQRLDEYTCALEELRRKEHAALQLAARLKRELEAVGGKAPGGGGGEAEQEPMVVVGGGAGQQHHPSIVVAGAEGGQGQNSNVLLFPGAGEEGGGLVGVGGAQGQQTGGPAAEAMVL